MRQENILRAEEYLVRRLHFPIIKTDLVHSGIISHEECIRYSNFLHHEPDKQNANHHVMSAVVKKFFTSDHCTEKIIEILQKSVLYSSEAYALTEFLECQRFNARTLTKWTFRRKAYYFPNQHSKHQDVNFYSNDAPESTQQAPQENATTNNINPHEPNISYAPHQETAKSHHQNMEASYASNAGVESLGAEYSDGVQEMNVGDVEMDSVITSMEQATVTPPDQTDEKISAVFHQVTDFADMSDKSNVDQVNVYDIVHKIGVADIQIKDRFKTQRLGKPMKNATRPLKVTFKDERTRNFILESARKNQSALEDVNIVPFVKREKKYRNPFQFGKGRKR